MGRVGRPFSFSSPYALWQAKLKRQLDSADRAAFLEAKRGGDMSYSFEILGHVPPIIIPFLMVIIIIISMIISFHHLQSTTSRPKKGSGSEGSGTHSG